MLDVQKTLEFQHYACCGFGDRIENIKICIIHVKEQQEIEKFDLG